MKDPNLVNPNKRQNHESDVSDATSNRVDEVIAAVASPESISEVQCLLDHISADDYVIWFEVACALKRLGVPYEVFRSWSATSEKFDEEECSKKWADLPEAPRAGWPTLRKYAGAASFVPVPEQMLGEPQTEDECAAQMAHYLVTSFKPGEFFELCAWKQGPGDRLVPDRQNDLKGFEENDTEEALRNNDILRSWVRATSVGGFVVGLNPVSVPPDFQGYAPSDAMVTDDRFALLESDEIPTDEQWAKIKQMRLPIQSVVHSAHKSLHLKCRVDAGANGELYKERVAKLIEYVNRFGFRADTNCRNASRLTRLPGALRDGKRQYLVCGACGYPDWERFELCELNSTSVGTNAPTTCDSKGTATSNCHHTDTSASSAMQEEAALLDELKAQYGIPFTSTAKGEVKKLTERFWAGYVMRKHELYKGDGIVWKYDEETGLWNLVEYEDLNDIICSTAHDYGITYGHEDLDSKFDEPHCKRLQGFMRNSKDDLFQSRPKNAIHLANGMVEIRDDGTCTLKPFAREYYSRNQCPFPYDPKAQCPRFISELLEPVFEQDDIAVLQLAFGQAMLAYNLRQKFFILTGTPGGGKGTIVNIMRSIIGPQNCAELRTEHLGNRFETAGYIGKSMLFGNDVPSDFLRCERADTIKKLTGGDPNDAEIKGVTKKFQIDGHFNLVITSNGRLLVKVDNDLGAWMRRIVLLELGGEPPAEPIPDFANVLLREEGAGIVNWAIEGAARVLRDGFPKESLSSRRVERLLLESNSIVGFLGTSIERTDSGAGITIGELICEYEQWCRRNEWEPQLDTESKRKLKQGLEMRFHVTESHDIIRKDEVSNETTAMRGYHGVAFKETPPTA